MNIEVPLRERTRAVLSFAPHDRRFRLNMLVQGERPRTSAVEPDLYFYFEDGGFLTLRPLEPITAAHGSQQTWSAAYGLERRQLMLLAIYPMVRMRSDAWTGGAGVVLDRTGPCEALMLAAQRSLGLEPLPAKP